MLGRDRTQAGLYHSFKPAGATRSGNMNELGSHGLHCPKVDRSASVSVELFAQRTSLQLECPIPAYVLNFTLGLTFWSAVAVI